MLLAGDFNDTPETEPIKIIKQNFKSSHASLNYENEPIMTIFACSDEGEYYNPTIDFVFYQGAVKPVGYL